MTQLTKNFPQDFPNGINIHYLEYELRNYFATNVQIKSNMISITFKFDKILSTDELNYFDTIINNHDTSKIIRDIVRINITISSDCICNNEYRKVADMFYDGKRFKGIEKLIISTKESAHTEFSVRVFDKNYVTILSEHVFENLENQTNIVTNFTNIPKQDTILEIHVKTNTDGILNINTIDIHFYT